MKTLAALMFAAASLCLLGCPDEKAADSAKPSASTSAAPAAAPPAAAGSTKPAATGGW